MTRTVWDWTPPSVLVMVTVGWQMQSRGGSQLVAMSRTDPRGTVKSGNGSAVPAPVTVSGDTAAFGFDKIREDK
jgi:hypothetical protein